MEMYEIYLCDSKNNNKGGFFPFTSERKIDAITEIDLDTFFQKEMDKFSFNEIDISSLDYINSEILRDDYSLSFLELPILV